MTILPTDLRVLEFIYSSYRRAFLDDNPQRATRNYVPINLEELAKAVGEDQSILFGRLYHDLDAKYGFVKSDGTKVPLFTPVAGTDRNCVNFPLVAGLVARLQDEHARQQRAMRVSLFALGASAASVLVAIASLVVAIIAVGVRMWFGGAAQ